MRLPSLPGRRASRREFTIKNETGTEKTFSPILHARVGWRNTTTKKTG